MARKKSPTLTEAEHRLMDILWTAGRATVNDVIKADRKRPKLAYTTVLTMLRILEDKGYVRHEKEGRAFAYLPLVGREEARHSAVKHLMNRFFDDSPELLLLNLLENKQIEPDELERLRQLIDQAEEEAK